jgi:uncharacterized protein YecE (DUF72 family)
VVFVEKKVLIGTSGWGYDEWVGPFYPKGLTQKDFLLYYSEIFYTNEINTTFYNIPSKWVVESWVKRTPSNFIFSVKVPQSITHTHKLDVAECSDDLVYFLDVMDPMIKANKLLAFLIQLPPSFKKKEHFENLIEFIDCWPQDVKKKRYSLVVEFRHKSWIAEDVFNYLRNNSLTYCGVIEPLLPPRMDVTNPELAYVRFHGYGKKIWFDYFFSDDEIIQWAEQIRNIINEARTIGIYFNNHFSGYAAKNSLMMMKELKLTPKNDPEVIDILDIKKRSGTYSKGQTSLDKFIPKP